MQVILASPPETAEEAAQTGYPVAILAWQVRRGYRLWEDGALRPVPRMLLAADVSSFSADGSVNALAGELEGRARALGAEGIVLDAGAAETAQLRDLALRVRKICRGTLYVTGRFSVPGAIALTETAVSGGTLEGRLHEAAAAGRAALDVEMTETEFRLPDRTGEGRPLAPGELEALHDRYRPRVFFSRELCVRYFSLRDGDGARMILFDDGESLLQKLRTGEAAGIDIAFLPYPRIRPYLPRILSRYPPDGRSSGCAARSCSGEP